MIWLRRIFGILLVLMVGFASNGPAWSASNANDDASSPSHSSDTNGDGQDDSTATIDLFYLHKRFELAAPLRELEKPAFAPALNEVPQKASAIIFSRSLPFLLSTGISAARAGLMPRAPSLV